MEMCCRIRCAGGSLLRARWRRCWGNQGVGTWSGAQRVRAGHGADEEQEAGVKKEELVPPGREYHGKLPFLFVVSKW